MAVEEFEAGPHSVQQVRHFVRETLHGVAHLDDIVLAASELATNAVRHAQTNYTVRLDVHDSRVRIEVSDGSSVIPAVEELADSKRGLRIVQMISESWGIDLTDIGKKVWVEFSDRNEIAQDPSATE